MAKYVIACALEVDIIISATRLRKRGFIGPTKCPYIKQEVQLSRRGRTMLLVIQYITRSSLFKVIRNDTLWAFVTLER